MRYSTLALKMVRYRVALTTIVPFFLLGIAVHGGMLFFSWNYLWGVLILAMSHIAATSMNDIADKDIDAVNLKSSTRPLVTGQASQKDLLILVIVVSVGVVLCALVMGTTALVIVALSLFINYLYSMPPIHLSHRAFAAPVALSALYAVLPYCLGVVSARGSLSRYDVSFLLGLSLLFCGRILLKDFRDRVGDAAYGKRTFLVRYGKTATCIASFSCIILGNIVFMVTMSQFLDLVSLMLLEVFFVPIVYMLYRLWKARRHDDEQAAIGIGAKMANGLIITTLGLVILHSYGSGHEWFIPFAVIFVCMYMLLFMYLINEPKKTVIGYRG